MSTLQEDQYIFLTMSCSVLLKIRNVSDKSCRENQNTLSVFNKCFQKNHAVYVITWQHIVVPDRP